MKRLLMLIFILATVFLLASCAPVPFSEATKMRKDCYIDVVEIHPETVGYSSSLIYCTCKLADGSTVWMEVSNESFVEYLDSEANANDLKYTARNITYDTPVRLSGTLSTTDTKLNPSSDADTTNIFKFVTADKVESRIGGKRVSREVVYTEDVAINAPTYVDIVSINPKYTDTNLYLATTGVLCECTTADGDIVWIYVDAEKYVEYFDPTVDLHYMFAFIHTGLVYFVEPVRLFGAVLSSDRYMSKFTEDDVVPKTVISFKSANKHSLDKNNFMNQPPTKYEGGEYINQNVYVNIVSITPVYTYGDYMSLLINPTGLVCKCITEDGNEVWVAMTTSQFETEFTSEYLLNNYEYFVGVDIPITSDNRINCVVKSSGSIANNLYEKIGSNTVLVLTSR